MLERWLRQPPIGWNLPDWGVSFDLSCSWTLNGEASTVQTLCEARFPEGVETVETSLQLHLDDEGNVIHTMVTPERGCSDEVASAVPPPGPFARLSAGAGWITCGIRPSGELACWGNQYKDLGLRIAGLFEDVVVGFGQACGLRQDGSVACWGVGGRDDTVSSPDGAFVDIASSVGITCGLRSSNDVECWGWQADEHPSQIGLFTNIDGGPHHICGLRPNGDAGCWSPRYGSEVESRPGPFTEVRVGLNQACGLHEAGTVDCWALRDHVQPSVPKGTFEALGEARSHLCGIRAKGSIDCWNCWPDDVVQLGQCNPPCTSPTDRFASVSAGLCHTCGLTEEGDVRCWGYVSESVISAESGFDIGEYQASCFLSSGGTCGNP